MSPYVAALSLFLVACTVTPPQRTQEQVANATAKSVFLIRMANLDGRKYSGTCFAYKRITIIDKEGPHFKTFYLTNHHVIEGIDPFGHNFIYMPKTPSTAVPAELEPDQCFPFRVETKDETLDIAVVSTVTSVPVPTLEVDFKSPFYQQEILTQGYPMGGGLMTTYGHVNYYKKGDLDWSAACDVFLGNSGGPVIDSKTGKVVGVTSQLGSVQGTNIFVYYMQFFVAAYDFQYMLDRAGLL